MGNWVLAAAIASVIVYGPIVLLFVLIYLYVPPKLDEVFIVILILIVFVLILVAVH